MDNSVRYLAPSRSYFALGWLTKTSSIQPHAMKAHLVTATDIAQWADTLEARALLPKLIRMLASASKIPFTEIRFPSDEGIQ